MRAFGHGGNRCPICGAPNHSCGGPSSVIPVDERVTHVDERKKREPAPNKKRLPSPNKGAERGR